MVNFYSNATVGNTILISNLTTELQTVATDAVTSGFVANENVIAKVVYAVLSQLFTPIGLALGLTAISLFMIYKVRRYKQITAELVQLRNSLLSLENAQQPNENNYNNKEILEISNQIMKLYKEISESYLYPKREIYSNINLGAQERWNQHLNKVDKEDSAQWDQYLNKWQTSSL